MRHLYAYMQSMNNKSNQLFGTRSEQRLLYRSRYSDWATGRAPDELWFGSRQSKGLFSPKRLDRHWALPASRSMRSAIFLPGRKGAHYPQLVSRSRVCVGMPPLPYMPSWNVQVFTFYEHEIYYISIFKKGT